MELNRSEAISWTKSFLNEPEKPVPSHFSTTSFTTKKESWIPLKPPSRELPKLNALSSYLAENYHLVAVYPYRDVQGVPIFYILRLESKQDGKKIVLPLSYGKSHEEEQPFWKLKNHSRNRNALYNMHLIDQHPKKPILIVEGEKTADAAYRLVGGDYVVVSWVGGAASAKDVNWKLLHA